jgi:hypothetical protein
MYSSTDILPVFTAPKPRVLMRGMGFGVVGAVFSSVGVGVSGVAEIRHFDPCRRVSRSQTRTSLRGIWYFCGVGAVDEKRSFTARKVQFGVGLEGFAGSAVPDNPVQTSPRRDSPEL